jgi:hypothetical protein
MDNKIEKDDGFWISKEELIKNYVFIEDKTEEGYLVFEKKNTDEIDNIKPEKETKIENLVVEL